MNSYTVLYRIESIMSPLDIPFGFSCMAEDTDHAEEQCLNAYPDCDIMWVSMDMDYADTVNEYQSWGLE
jgi:hypothetical protein